MLKVLSKEREIQKTRDIKEDFSSRIHDVSEKLKAISTKLKEKATDVEHAKDETKVRGSWRNYVFVMHTASRGFFFKFPLNAEISKHRMSLGQDVNLLFPYPGSV